MLAKCFIYIHAPILIFLFSFTIVSAQTLPQNKIDNLTQLYGKTEKFDNKKKLLKNLSNEYQNIGNWYKYDEILKQTFSNREEWLLNVV